MTVCNLSLKHRIRSNTRDILSPLVLDPEPPGIISQQMSYTFMYCTFDDASRTANSNVKESHRPSRTKVLRLATTATSARQGASGVFTMHIFMPNDN